MAIRVSDYVYLIETGNVKLEGIPKEIESLEDVRKIYLGG